MPKWTEEQQLAIDRENSNIIVSAGAGSGKTAVLTARVIRKLKMNVHINELLILTFTNKAAFEMKERIRKAISKDEDIISELDFLDSSYITTFDSFALSIVKKYSYLLKIDKNVKIADSSIIFLEKKKILDTIFDEMYEKASPNFLKLINDFTIKDDKEIKKAILSINDKLDLRFDKKEYLDRYVSDFYDSSRVSHLSFNYLSLIKEYIKQIDRLLDLFSETVDIDFFDSFKEPLEGLLNSSTYDEIKANLDVKMPNLPRGSEEDTKTLKKEITLVLEKIFGLVRFDSIDDVKSCFESTEPYVRAIIEIIELLDERISSFKRVNNVYEFTDISKMAIRVVKENENVREELKKSFKEIMIDEYQDTSDLQEAFISEIENNNVYMVGDIKQSIYRFRNANPYLFKSKYDSYSKNDGGFKIDLTKNFRSRSEVIDNINLIFDLLMTDSLGGADYKKTHRMIFGNTTYENEGKTNQDNNLQLFNYTYDKELGYSKEEIEIFFIANDIKNKVKSHYKIFDKDELCLRDANYGDFAILLDKSLNFDLYKKIFEYNGIPMTKYSSTNITSEIEIFLIKNIIRLIICEKEKNYDVTFKYAFTSIARSYLMEYSDEDIFEYFCNGNFEDSSLMKTISSISYNLDSLSLKEIIILIIEKFDFYMKQIKVGDVTNRIHRIEAILDVFGNLSDMGYTIYDAYDYLDNLIEEEYKLEVKNTDNMENSVKIMTIHASKGLEFPVCYFASLHSLFNIRDLNEKFMFSNDYGIITPYFKEGIGKTFFKDMFKYNYISSEISEKIRLFYVALTRAKEKMIIVTSLDENKRPYTLENARSFLDMLNYAYDYIKPYVLDIDLDKIGLSKDYNSIKKYNYKEKIERTEGKIEIRSLNIPNSIVQKKKISKEVEGLMNKDDIDKMKFGSDIHKVLELLDFKNPSFSSFDISDFYKKRILDFINCIDAKDAISIYKEYEFIYKSDDTIEHGIIDLLLEYNDSLKIVDYKLKNIEDEHYIEQLNSYKEYVSRKTNKKIDIYLFSITDGLVRKI